MPKKYKFLEFAEVTSTNDVCLSEMQKSDIPTVVFADSQTQGRGRNLKSWSSPRGNISYSFGIRSSFIDPSITVKTGLIVIKALKKEFNKKVSLKWPNDLIYKNKKVGGILVESQTHNNETIIITGIGINLRIDNSEEHWGDLGLDGIAKNIKHNFVTHLTDELLKLEKLNNINWCRDWNNSCMHIDKNVSIDTRNESYIFLGIDELGQAKLKNMNSEIETYSESSLKVDGLY